MWPIIKRFVVPTGTQAVLSLAASVLILGLTFRDHLLKLVTVASGITAHELQTSYHQALGTINNVGFVPKLTIGLFWAGVGMVAYFLLLTLFNFIIAIRNEVVVDTTFTNTGGASLRFRLPLMRLALTAILGVYLLLALNTLLPHWINLAGPMLLLGFSAVNLVYLIIAILGLAITMYVAWMLALAIKNLDGLL